MKVGDRVAITYPGWLFVHGESFVENNVPEYLDLYNRCVFITSPSRLVYKIVAVENHLDVINCPTAVDVAVVVSECGNCVYVGTADAFTWINQAHNNTMKDVGGF